MTEKPEEIVEELILEPAEYTGEPPENHVQDDEEDQDVEESS